MGSINWLHLTDWHVGQSAQGHLYPNVRFEFEKDLRSLIESYGGLDLVFITGDLVQSGARKQFRELEQNLNRMWAFFDSMKCRPLLMAVPGNHDLRRPDPSKSAMLALKVWHEQPEVQQTFWRKTPSDLRRCIDKSFDEYQRWLSETTIPLVPAKKGLLPGDSAATFAKDDVRVGVIGLNSTFLQLRGGDYERRLALSARQFSDMCGADFIAWLEGHDFSVLLTHQPDSWLSPESVEEFRREIAPPDRFRLHLCGHLHDGKTTVQSAGGSGSLRRHQGASFFGLEFYGDDQEIIRRHGYLFGQWNRDGSTVTERLWPRVAVEKESGALGFVANPSSYLDADSAIRDTFEVQMAAPGRQAGSITDMPAAVGQGSREEQVSFPLGRPLEIAEVNARLKRALRFLHPCLPQHVSVRADERQSLADALKDHRYAWVVADWGMGKDGFIASVVRSDLTSEDESLRFDERLFQLQCDAFEEVGELERAFRPQFGLSLVDFLQCINSAGPTCLVLDGIQTALTGGAEKPQLLRLLGLLLDQAPCLSIVVVSRTPLRWRGSPIEIHPLDLPDLRAYVQSHPNSQPEFTTGDVLERFFEASGGLPVHAERMLERLRLASFDAVLDEENALIELAAVEAPLHRALQQAIEAVRRRDGENGSRGLSLLRVLAILTYGETIEQLKNFLPTTPLFPRDAESLHSAALIDPIPLNSSTPLISSRGHSAATNTIGPKILRVPKQVRDCVLASLSVEERGELLAAAGEFFFGHGWRVGKKPKLRKVPPAYRDYVAHGVGNEYAVLQLMIANAKETRDVLSLKAAVRLGEHYCGILKAADRNRDLRLVTKGLLRLLEDTEFEEDKRELNRLCGRACRLTGHHEEAVAHLEASFGGKGSRTGEARAYTLLEMATALDGAGDEERAIETAKQVKALATPGSLIESQAKAKLKRFEPSSPERFQAQIRLKKEARKKGWTSHANDLSLMLAADSNTTKEKMALLDEVLESNEEGWNRFRAVVQKAILAVRSKDLGKITKRDRRNLLGAYSFSHTQRLEMFDRCHEALWSVLESEGSREGLYRLFQHSSFIWRIRGDERTELAYFERLNEMSAAAKIEGPEAMLIEVRYFIKRAAVLLVRIASR